MATKRIDQFYQATGASSNAKFLMYDPLASNRNQQDQLVSFSYVEALITAGVNITINNLTSQVQSLSTSVAGKINSTEKAAALGVATLGSDGKVLPSQMPFDLSSLVGTWDASTNTPTLSDGTGVDKTAYIVSVGGTQNLGSGAITVVAGNTIIHLGGTWQSVDTAVTLGVTNWNGLTGSVVGDTSNTPATTDKRYVTDNMLAALAGTAGVPSGSNKFVTSNDSRLSGASVTLNGNPFNTVSLYGDGVNEGGNGTTGFQTLASLSYTSGTAAVKWPRTAAEYGTIPTSMTLDDVMIYEALLSCRDLGLPNLIFPGKVYGVTMSLGDAFPIPKTLTGVTASTGSLRFSMFGFGCTMRLLSSGAGKTFFLREPADETESQAIAPYGIWIDGFKLQGDSNTTLTGMRICSTKNSKVSNCIYRNMGTGLEMRFCLSATLDTNRFFGCTGRSVYLGQGDWSGASPASSTTQVTAINQYLTIGLGLPGFEIINTDSCNIIGGVWENSVDGLCGIYYSNQSTTVCKNLYVQGVHIEQDYSEAAIYAICQDVGTIKLSDIFEQNVSYLISLNNISGTNRMLINNVPKSGGFQFRNQGGAGGAWSFTDVKLPNNPTTPVQVVDPVKAVWDITGAYATPLDTRVKINPLTL